MEVVDAVIDAAAEGVRTCTMECFRYGSRVSNGSAAFLLGLALGSNYSTTRRKRIYQDSQLESRETEAPAHSVAASPSKQGAPGPGAERDEAVNCRQRKNTGTELSTLQASSLGAFSDTEKLAKAAYAATLSGGSGCAQSACQLLCSAVSRWAAATDVLCPACHCGACCSRSQAACVVCCPCCPVPSPASMDMPTRTLLAGHAVDKEFKLQADSGASAHTGVLEDSKLAVLVGIDAAAVTCKNAARCLLCSRNRVTGGRATASAAAAAAGQQENQANPHEDASSSHSEYDGEESISVSTIRHKWGLPVRTYRVQSADGYVLQLIRIPRPSSKKAVYFQHGLLDTAAGFVATGHLFSLACRMYQAGHDVWLGNLRGTTDTFNYDFEALEKAHSYGLPRPSMPSPASCFRSRPPTEEKDAGSSGAGAASAGASGGAAASAAGPTRRAPQQQPSTQYPPRPVAFPSHVSLTPLDAGFWSYSVDDHALDVMALLRAVHTIKRREMTAAGEQAMGMRSHATAAAGRAPATAAAAAAHDAAGDGQEIPPDEQEGGGGEQADKRGPMEVHDCPPPEASGGDAYTLVMVGHSMGGYLAELAPLFIKATQRPCKLTRMVLLSPAGMHYHTGKLVWLSMIALNALFAHAPEGPFPLRLSLVERLAAKLLQDLKRSQSTADILSAAGAAMFGGDMHRFVFRHIRVSEYPLGGTSRRVIRHGVQCVLAGDMLAYSFGRAGNLYRYGVHPPPNYRHDFGLLSVPMRFVSGGRDWLIPAADVAIHHASVSMVKPGLSAMHTVHSAGHLDFTLGLDDRLIAHTVRLISLQPAKLPSHTRHAMRSSSHYQSRPSAQERLHSNSDSDSASDLDVEVTLPSADAQHMQPITTVAARKTHALADAFATAHDGLLAALRCKVAKGDCVAAATAWRAVRSQLQALLAAYRPCSVMAQLYPWLRSLDKMQEAFHTLDAEAQGDISRLHRRAGIYRQWCLQQGELADTQLAPLPPLQLYQA